jgi:hypothetical protein
MLDNVIVVEIEGKLTIKQISNSVTHRVAYMKAVQTYILKGYRLPLKPNNWDSPMGTVRGLRSLVTLYAEGKDPSLEVEPVVVEPEVKPEVAPEVVESEVKPEVVESEVKPEVVESEVKPEVAPEVVEPEVAPEVVPAVAEKPKADVAPKKAASKTKK